MLDNKYERERTYEETMTRVLGKEIAEDKKKNKIYLYSTQTLNFKGLAMKEMRERLGKVKGKIACDTVCDDRKFEVWLNIFPSSPLSL